jgi:hypothetical protein
MNSKDRKPIVPRIVDVTGKQSREDAALQRECERKRKDFRDDTSRYGYGTPEGKAAWLARIRRTRSF